MISLISRLRAAGLQFLYATLQSKNDLKVVKLPVPGRG